MRNSPNRAAGGFLPYVFGLAQKAKIPLGEAGKAMAQNALGYKFFEFLKKFFQKVLFFFRRVCYTYLRNARRLGLHRTTQKTYNRMRCFYA